VKRFFRVRERRRRFGLWIYHLEENIYFGGMIFRNDSKIL